MKKKIIAMLLALSMPLAGCDFSSLMFWKKAEPQEEQKQEEQKQEEQVLSESQKASSSAMHDSIYTFVVSSFGEESAKAVDAYIVADSNNAALNGVDGIAVNAYISRLTATPIDTSDPIVLFDIASDIRSSGLLDDGVYYLLTLLEASLRANALNTNNEEDIALYNKAVEIIEGEGNNLPTNIYQSADKIIAAYQKFTANSFMLDAMKILSTEEGKQGTINPVVLKTLISKSSDILLDLTTIRPNVKYLVNLAKNTGVELIKIAEGVPNQLAALINYIDANKVLDFVFNMTEDVVRSLKSIPQSYYDHLGEISEPLESYLYAGIGLIEYLYKSELVTANEIDAVVEFLLAFNKEAGRLVSQIEGAPAYLSVILQSAKLSNIADELMDVLNAILALNLESVDAARIAKVLAEFIPAIQSSGMGTTYSDITSLPEEYKSLLPMSQYEAAIENGEEFVYEEEDSSTHSEIEIDPTTGLKSFSVTEYSYHIKYYPGDEYQEAYTIFEMHVEVENVTYSSFQSAADLIYDVLVELAHKEYTDAILDQVSELVEAVLDLYNEVKGMLPLDEDDSLNVEVGAGLVNVLTHDKLANVKRFVNEVFVAAASVFSAFIPGEEEANIDFTDFVVFIMFDQIPDFIQKMDPEKLTPVYDVLFDAYNLADSVGMAKQFIDFLVEKGNGYLDIIKDVTSAQEFADTLYNIAVVLLTKQA